MVYQFYHLQTSSSIFCASVLELWCNGYYVYGKVVHISYIPLRRQAVRCGFTLGQGAVCPLQT